METQDYRNQRRYEVAVKERPALRFKDITLADMPLINQLLQHSSTRTCDYTIGGIYMWIDCFGYEYCVYDDTLFIKGFSENRPGETAFSLPIGKMPLQDATELLRDYCKAESIPLVFSAIPEDRVDAVAAVTGGEVEQLDGWSDYIYEATALASLSGKALSKKRNHVNRFMNDNPDYEFEAITPDLLPEVELFFSGRPLAEKIDTSMALYEQHECSRVLAHYSSFPFEGAVLRGQSGEIVAFTVGEVIGDTLYVHIEKMNHEVPGAGETINRLFAAEMLHRHPQIRYINREEDMGDPGLRYAKESYRPAMLINKYNVRI
ncbi:MAG: phosphatidylglycerol lysyltransferase domain-containing protein [Muribaculaceae bacterium]|nr:phosphatidylglycerol lysyltransferase domain-containing protein [Muribaculaceae bacterium]MDE5929000.1 phosphatidylglycerol lysyltransferase domain-containing protein [Muribaculaceae bacterium]